MNRTNPDFEFENRIDSQVCGLDEVGRAPLAGPVTAACVYINDEQQKDASEIWSEVNDSKKLALKKREQLFDLIKENCTYAIAGASAREIEDSNIVQASFLAMTRAFEEVQTQLKKPIHTALVDGHIAPQLPCPNIQTIIKGDSKSVSIAAASILAKVTRDRLMAKLAEEHPHYGWHTNVGYPTPAHLEAIDTHGITEHHRRTFAPVRNYIDFGQVRAQLNLKL